MTNPPKTKIGIPVKKETKRKILAAWPLVIFILFMMALFAVVYYLDPTLNP